MVWSGCGRFIAIVMACLTAGAAPSLAFEPDEVDHIVDDLWQVALRANPEIEKSEKFYRAYAKMLLPYVHDFDGFKSVLMRVQPYSCEPNLLCRNAARVVAGFRVGSKPTALDLIRFAREHTCYGFFSDAGLERRFVSDLERVLTSSGVGADGLLPSDFGAAHPNARFILYRLARARDGAGNLVFKVGGSPSRPLLDDLFRKSGAKQGFQRPDPSPLDPLTEAAAREACMNAFGTEVLPSK